MDSWDLYRYQRPCLRADKVYSDGATVVVVADHEEFDIQVPGTSPPDVVGLLERLRDPDSHDWAEVLGAPDRDSRHELLDALDTLGLLADFDADGGSAVAEADRRRVRAVIEDLLAWLLDPTRPWDRRSLVASIEALSQPLGQGLPIVETGGIMNFPLTTLILQQRYWDSSAPLAAATVRLLFAGLTGAQDLDAARTLDDLAGGPESPHDVISAVHGAAALLALSTRSDAARICTPPPGPGRVSGINLALAAERAAHRALDQIGETSYISGLEGGDFPQSFVRGAFLEEYCVNLRFVETIAPSLTHRYRNGLRTLVSRYYNEEYGHEKYERATCLAMGISEERLDRHHPSPYHLAYVDAYTAISQTQPVAYPVSVMVTEGLPGDPFGINDVLDPEQLGEEAAAVFQEHETLNNELAHSTLARLLLAEVPSVSAAQAAITLDIVTYLIELTHRAWSLLYDLHADGPSAESLPPLYASQR